MVFQFRSDKQQLEIGVYNDEQYQQCRKKSIISLQMCFMGWLYELLDFVFIVIVGPILKFKFSFTNTYLCDVVMMFVVIPFLQILNDDDTKDIIYQESWIHGLKFMFGIYKPPPENNIGSYGMEMRVRNGNNRNSNVEPRQEEDVHTQDS